MDRDLDPGEIGSLGGILGWGHQSRACNSELHLHFESKTLEISQQAILTLQAASSLAIFEIVPSIAYKKRMLISVRW